MKRSVVEYRMLGFLGFVVSFIFASVIFLLVKYLGPVDSAEMSFAGVSLKGASHLVGFAVAFLGGLWYMSKLFIIPVATAVSAGISAPPPAVDFMEKCPIMEKSALSIDSARKTVMEKGIIIVTENGKPYGVLLKAAMLDNESKTSIDDRIIKWAAVQKIEGRTPLHEIFFKFKKYSRLIVTDTHDRPLGVINIKSIIRYSQE